MAAIHLPPESCIRTLFAPEHRPNFTPMDWSAVLANLQNPPILFFLLGLLTPLLRCQLEIPAPVTKLIALYLLWAIGFKGGVELSRGGLDAEAWLTLLAAMLLATATPLWVFAIARRRFGVHDAAAQIGRAHV